MIFVQVCLQVHSSYIKHKQKILNEMPIMKNYILERSWLFPIKEGKKIIWGTPKKNREHSIYLCNTIIINFFFLGETLNVD